MYISPYQLNIKKKQLMFTKSITGKKIMIK